MALDASDLERGLDGSATLLVRRSKTEQDGEGTVTWLAPDTLQFIDAWTAAAGIVDGPLFRSVRKGDRVGGALAARDDARLYKRIAVDARLTADIAAAFSEHNPRVGLHKTCPRPARSRQRSCRPAAGARRRWSRAIPNASLPGVAVRPNSRSCRTVSEKKSRRCLGMGRADLSSAIGPSPQGVLMSTQPLLRLPHVRVIDAIPESFVMKESRTGDPADAELGRWLHVSAEYDGPTPVCCDEPMHRHGLSRLTVGAGRGKWLINGIIGRTTHQPGRKAESRHWYGNDTTCFVCSSLPGTASTRRL